MIRHLVNVTLAAIIIACVPACHQNNAQLMSPQPGAPCGNTGVPCYEQAANGNIEFTHDCCWPGSVCGGISPINVGCPADSCCAEGDDGSGGFAARKPRIVGKKWHVD